MAGEHEVLFGKAFITSEKRARFLQYLGNARRRPEALALLDHRLPYIIALATAVPPTEDYPEGVARLLAIRGAGPTCHLIVRGSRLDGRERPLEEALREVFLHPLGAVVSCIPGVLAYYKPAAPGGGILLEKPRRPRT